MANFGVFIGFGFPSRGREKQAGEAFNGLVQYLTQQVQGGAIESFEPCLLQAHGGDLDGFVLVRGERAKLDQMVASADFNRVILNGQLSVENLGVVNCQLGEEIQRQMGVFMEAASKLS